MNNISTKNAYQLLNGAGTKAGYMLNGETYFDVDEGLQSYYFEYTFP